MTPLQIDTYNPGKRKCTQWIRQETDVGFDGTSIVSPITETWRDPFLRITITLSLPERDCQYPDAVQSRLLDLNVTVCNRRAAFELQNVSRDSLFRSGPGLCYTCTQSLFKDNFI